MLFGFLQNMERANHGRLERVNVGRAVTVEMQHLGS